RALLRRMPAPTASDVASPGEQRRSWSRLILRATRTRAHRDGATVSDVEEIDHRIVTLLAKDGRMSFTDLAKETGLSVSAVHQRVRRLEKRGVIRGYAALVDHDAIGLPLTAFVSIKPI